MNEQNRAPESKSYLWIRRGGPPEKPVVLVDYSPSRSSTVATGLLSDFKGYLVTDAYGGYNDIIVKNKLKFVACNDHARRRFVEVVKNRKEDKNPKTIIAQRAVQFYKQLYKIENQINHLPPDEKHQIRQKKSIPIWNQFKDWIAQVNAQGVLHTGTQKATNYLLNHWDALIRYCEDGRLPISNIRSKHVAKTIALARKNFMFSSVVSCAETSAMIYSILETAKANGLNPHKYLTVLLTELPKSTDLDSIEKLLPWRLRVESLNQLFNSYPCL